jgi:aminoglycoside phosphotransferase (APT) family kinase protein
VSSSDESPAVVEGRPPVALRSLARFLDGHDLGDGPVEAEPIGDGHSNITYLVRRGGSSWVLRRPPRPPLPPSAHDVLREFRFIQACAGTPVRVPEPILACADLDVIGAPFYLMSHVAGDVLTTRLPPAYDPQVDPSAIVDDLVTALAEIHAMDWRATDLAEVTAAPEDYLERQLSRFTRLWQHNRTRDLPVVDRVAAWLARTQPQSGPATLVHGDYRLGNTIFAPGSPPVLKAVLDWELATVGDPLADLGYLSATYAVPGAISDPLVRLGSVTAEQGFPARSEVVARYAAISGRDVGDLVWYEALALWKSAVFLEGSYARHLSGTTDDPFFAGLATGVPELAERAWELARSAGAN